MTIIPVSERFSYISTHTPVYVTTVKERFDCVITPAPMYIITEIERFGYVSTPTPVSDIPIEGEDWIFKYSYSSVYFLCKREVWICKHS